MNSNKFISLLFVFWASSLLGQVGEFSFQYLGKKEGLSQNSVFAIAQDSTGFLWFGTRDGLNRFDGYRFEVYRREGELKNAPVGNDIRTLYVDPLTKDIWIGTLSGLSRFDPETGQFRNYTRKDRGGLGLAGDIIRCIYRDLSGKLWVGTSTGLSVYDSDKDLFFPGIADSTMYAFVAEDISSIGELDDERLLIGTTRGALILDQQQGDKWQFVPELKDLHITCFQRDSVGAFWVGTNESGVLYWNPRLKSVNYHRRMEGERHTLSHNSVRALDLDVNGNLWIGTFAGLNFLPCGQTEFTEYQKSLPEEGGLKDNSIRSLLIDRTGSLWVGTYYGGVNHMDERYNHFSNFRQDRTPFSLSGNVVSSFAEDKKGNFWIGTEGGGLNYFETKKEKFTHFKSAKPESSGPSGNSIKELLLDGDQLWLGTFRAGLNRYDLKTGDFTHFRHQPNQPGTIANDNVYGLWREGAHLWILTYGGGLDIMDLNTGQIQNYHHNHLDDSSISSDLTRVLLKTEKGDFWLGTEKGLNQVQVDENHLPLTFSRLLQEEKIYCLAEDHLGVIWIGTFGNGLYSYDVDTKSLQHFSTVNGLPGNTVFGVVEANNGSLWLSTNNGLSRFDVSQRTFTNFDDSNGLKNLEYNFNAYYKSRSSKILFGGLNGFTYFNPADLQPNTYVAPVVFTYLKQNNETVKIGAADGVLPQDINNTTTVVFNYNDANFTIGFAALDFFSPENNHYAYLLDGLDREWNYVIGDNEVSYTIQREGTYTFYLQGGNSDGVWNDQVRKISIEVLPPPWRSPVAYLLYLGLLGMMIFAFLRFLHMRHQIELQEIAKQQQAHLLEMKLRFFTNITHEFRTPLTLIIGPLQTLKGKLANQQEVGEQLKQINRNAERLLNLVNQVLTFRKLATDYEPLQVERHDFIPFLKEIMGAFRATALNRQINFTFHSTAQEIKLWMDREKLEKVFFNLLANAFKFTPDGGKISVTLLITKERVIVRVKDSGVGVDPALEVDIFKRFYEKSIGQQSAIKNSGIGLAISKQMVGLHHGEIYVEEQQDKDTGAEFVVELFRGKKHFSGIDVMLTNKIVKEEVSQVSSLRVPSEEATITEPITASNFKLLVVDDNPEIRDYIKQIFAKDYKVFTAENGKEGLVQASSLLPDLIVSDVMMPEMDGIAFTRAVKQDERMSHIPIILLTARAASPFRLAGLRTGADDYLTKPFDPEELRLRVRNIILAHRVTKSRFGRVMLLEPEEIEVTTEDEVFLKSMVGILEENIGNLDFSVDDFARELTVSRTLMFDKIKALTGMTPNKLLRSFRLKRAAQLLTASDYRINQIASMVGFKDVRYFSQCFKKEYGCTPASYRSGEEE